RVVPSLSVSLFSDSSISTMDFPISSSSRSLTLMSQTRFSGTAFDILIFLLLFCIFTGRENLQRIAPCRFNIRVKHSARFGVPQHYSHGTVFSEPTYPNSVGVLVPVSGFFLV